VNDELGELERGLVSALGVLRPLGRIAVVSFHSLEDRIVKQFFSRNSDAAPQGSRHAPQTARQQAPLRLVTTRPQTPGSAEIAANPRSRSAKLRVAERLAA
jgi:16S rRNA (cytosine1402-N4)-methyltransferase